MRVKVGDKWHDAEVEPICVQLTKQDLKNVNESRGVNRKYAAFPDKWGTPDEMRDWMAEPDDLTFSSGGD